MDRAQLVGAQAHLLFAVGLCAVSHPFLIWLLGNRGSKVQLMLQLGEGVLSTMACVNAVHVLQWLVVLHNREGQSLHRAFGRLKAATEAMTPLPRPSWQLLPAQRDRPFATELPSVVPQ